MNHRSTPTQLALALALAWPVFPAWAASVSEVGEAAAPLQVDKPLHLALTYSIGDAGTWPKTEISSVEPDSSAFGALGRSATPSPSSSSSSSSTLRLRMESRLVMDEAVRLSRATPTPTPEQPRPATPGLPAQELWALPRSKPAIASPWNRGSADVAVDDEFNRALQRYVRLQMPALPIWQPPSRNAPVVPIGNAGAPVLLPPAPAFVPSADDIAPRRVENQKHIARGENRRSRVVQRPEWRLSDQAFKAYSRGDYAEALERADAAIKVAPNLVRMHQLRVYALQKLGRREEAARAAEQALAKGLVTPELQAAVTNLEAAPTDSAVPTTAQYRTAFPIATLAYQQLAAGKFADAASNAEIAVRTDPSQGAWSLLWLDALAQQQLYDKVLAAGEQSVRLGAPNRDAIAAVMRQANQSIAVIHAQKAYDALGQSRNEEAVAQARAAVRQAPEVVSHRLLLISALQAGGDLSGAERAASEALEMDDENTTVQLQRAYLRQQLGHGSAAQEDIEAVLSQDWIDSAQRRNARLIGADLALADNQSDRVLALLQALPEDDPLAQARRKALGSARSVWGVSEALPVTAYAPLQLCRETPYGTVCDMQPWDAPGTDNPAARAYAAYGQKRYPQAIALARQAVAADPDNAGNASLLTTTLAAGNADEQREALARLDTALQTNSQDANLLRQRAYLRLANHQPALALQDFVAARSSGDAPPTNVLDEAYALAAMGNRTTAAAILRQAIDDAEEGKLTLDAQQRFDTRSAIASFSREWGVTASVGYRGARAASNGLVGQPISVPGNAAFSTVEAYWRPPEFLNSSTSTFDVYGRLSNTLYSGTNVTGAQRVSDPCGGSLDIGDTRARGAAGFPTTTGAIGMRYTPSTEANLTFGLERQFFLGSASRRGVLDPSSDAVRCLLNQQASAVDFTTGSWSGAWQAYALYGFYEGTGLRIDRKSWFTMEGYVQAGYTLLDAPTAYTLRDSNGAVLGQSDGKLKRGQAFAAGEVRIGRSFVTDYNDRLVFFPHVSLAADWYSNRNRATRTPVSGATDFDLTGSGNDWSAGAGVGVNVRYWLRGDLYNAQRSYVDGSLQYRTRVGGVSDRAKGLFLTLSYTY